MTTATRTGAEEIAWDLSDLYLGPGDPRIDADMQSALDAARKFKESYHGRVASLGPHELAGAVAEQERIVSILSRAGIYAQMLHSIDTADHARGALLQKVREQGTLVHTDILFFNLEWIEIDDARADELLAGPALAAYRHHLWAQRRYRPHVLSEPEEKILTEKRVSGWSAWTRLFDELTAAMHVRVETEEISLEEAMGRLHHPERDVRRAAAEGITETLDDGLRTRALILNTVLLDKATDDRLRCYPDWLSSRNLSNEATDESVQALVDAVVVRYDIPHRYYALKAKLLGLDRLAYYDRYAPVSRSDSTATWEEAKEIVIDAYSAFAPTAGRAVADFFDRRWIDAPVRPNKEPGAYCMTNVPGVHPYVFVNFTGVRRSVLTLAHELGHGLHGALSQDLTYFNAGTPITMAETASVFGEALVFKRLLAAEPDPRERLDLLVGSLDDAIATSFRQIAMNRFEDRVHRARRETGELSVDEISGIWSETQAASLGDSVDISGGYGTWWSYIPHVVRSPGYVYGYAFGYLFSLAIFRRYEQEGQTMVEPYLDLLRAGGSETPESLARKVGMDLTDPRFWSDGLEAMDQQLAEAERLAAKLSE